MISELMQNIKKTNLDSLPRKVMRAAGTGLVIGSMLAGVAAWWIHKPIPEGLARRDYPALRRSFITDTLTVPQNPLEYNEQFRKLIEDFACSDRNVRLSVIPEILYFLIDEVRGIEGSEKAKKEHFEAHYMYQIQKFTWENTPVYKIGLVNELTYKCLELIRSENELDQLDGFWMLKRIVTPLNPPVTYYALECATTLLSENDPNTIAKGMKMLEQIAYANGDICNIKMHLFRTDLGQKVVARCEELSKSQDPAIRVQVQVLLEHISRSESESTETTYIRNVFSSCGLNKLGYTEPTNETFDFESILLPMDPEARAKLRFQYGEDMKVVQHIGQKYSPNGIKKLVGYYNLSYLGRYSEKTLDELYRNMLQEITKPIALVVFNKSDSKGAFHCDQEIIESLMGNYALLIVEVETKQELVNMIQKMSKKGKASLLIFGGHGTSTTVTFGDGYDGTLSSWDMQIFHSLKPYLKKDCDIVLISCSTGNPMTGNNIACTLSTVFEGVVFAPRTDTNIKNIVTRPGHVKDVIYNDRNALVKYHLGHMQ